MSENVILIIGASCIVAFMSSVSHPKHRAVSEGAFSLVLLLAVLSPVCEYIGGVFDNNTALPEPPSIEEGGEYERVAEEAFLIGIERLVADRYGIDGEEVTARCDGFDFSRFACERIYITLSGSAATSDHRGIKNFIEDNFEGDCIVEIEFG